MTKTNLKAVEAQPTERQLLAKAIADHAAAVKQAQHVRQAAEHAQEVVFRAADKLDEAQRALEKAKASEPDRIAAAALGEVPPGIAVKEADAAVTQVGNDLAIARRTHSALEGRLRREEEDVTEAKKAVERAKVAVATTDPDVVSLIAEQERVNRRLGELMHIFSFLGRSGFALTEYGFWPDKADASVIDPYRAWLAALETNADASLPG